MDVFINVPGERGRKDSEISDRSLSSALVHVEESPMNSQDTDLALSFDTPPESPVPDDSHLRSRVIQKLAKNFDIIGVIGCGSFGKVIEAIHNYDKRHDAIKCIPLDPRDDIDEIFQEAKHLASLEHNHVVRYRDSWIDDYPIEEIATVDERNNYNTNRIDHYVHLGILGSNQVSSSRRSSLHFCIQMEFCKTNLAQVIKKKLYQDPSRAWRIFWQMVEGLAYLHANRIIHRDLKPENVFMDHTDAVKIGDLGLSIKMSSGSRSPVKENYTEKNDIYDLAFIFSEMFGLTSMTVGKELSCIGCGATLQSEEENRQNCNIAHPDANPRDLLRQQHLSHDCNITLASVDSRLSVPSLYAANGEQPYCANLMFQLSTCSVWKSFEATIVVATVDTGDYRECGIAGRKRPRCRHRDIAWTISGLAPCSTALGIFCEEHCRLLF